MSAALEEKFGNVDFINDLDRGANNTIEFFKYSPNIKALIDCVMEEIQELHDAQKDIYSKVNIFDAVGSQLDDVFGTLLNRERIIGQTDQSYRLDLLAQSSVLSRSGEITVIKGLYKSLLGADSVRLDEYYPHSFIVDASVSNFDTISTGGIKDTLSKSKQAGVRFDATMSDDSEGFTFADSPGQTSPTEGFSGLSIPTEGGRLGTVLS